MPSLSTKSTTRVSSSSVAGCTTFLGRPRFFFGCVSVLVSAVFGSAGPTLGRRDLDLAVLLTGVPFGLVFAGVLPAASVFLGRPRPRLMGVGASWSFNGIVVVFVRVTFLTMGDMEFSPSLSGSACTVTLIRHGLAPPVLGVFMTIDLAGEEISNSCMVGRRFCFVGELVRDRARGVFCGFRVDVIVFS